MSYRIAVPTIRDRVWRADVSIIVLFVINLIVTFTLMMMVSQISSEIQKNRVVGCQNQVILNNGAPVNQNCPTPKP
jgi:hypothetical protein